MSLTPCCAPCPTKETVNVPGIEGLPGDDGSNGTNGVAAYTIVTGGFNVPADTVTPVIVGVANSSWTVIGQILIIGQGAGVALANPGPATFIVDAIPSPTSLQLLWLNYPGDVAAGSAISANAIVSPSGVQPASPLAIANGGTGAITKAAAQTALGLGQDAITSAGNGLTQDITASLVQVGAIDVQIPAAGAYLMRGNVSVELQGATFASSRAVTIELRNVTQNVTEATAQRNTGVQTTVVLPSIDWELPDKQIVGVANDHFQIRIMVAVIPSAGAFKVVGGSLSAIPLRKS